MNRRALLTIAFTLLLLCQTVNAAVSDEPQMNPFVIAQSLSRFIIPRIDLREPTTIQGALKFIYTKYSESLEEPSPSNTFVFESQLPESILQRHVALQDKNITMMQALRGIFADAPVSVTFEPGKVIFRLASPSLAKP